MKATAEEKEKMKQWHTLNKEMHTLRNGMNGFLFRRKNKVHPCKKVEKVIDYFIIILDRCEQDCLSPTDIKYTRLLKEQMVACYSVAERWIEQFNKENNKFVYTGVRKVKKKDEPNKWVFVGVKKIKKRGRPKKEGGMRVGLSNISYPQNNPAVVSPTRP